MNDYKKLNKLVGWGVFLIATIVYLVTLEPTASWWDCGEYIATAYKLQVGHPPGAPTFQLLGRFFSLFAFGNEAIVAYMINVMSALSSSFTILFLFWTITMLARKIVVGSGVMNKSQMYAVLGSGLVGALAFTFSDSFWFSASEGEVYAMSSLFTAVTFWAILRWESMADDKHALKWLILIAYLIGISIGVHLLNLLAIPAITFVYYFKKHKPTTKGMLAVGGLSIIILAVIMYLIIPGIVSLSGKFELTFINSFGMPFNSGTLFYFALLIGLIVLGHRYTVRKKMVIANTIILSFIFILIGYSSFFMLIIRANANTPINENQPEDAIGLLSYLNREQYGSYPIFYGQYYNAPIVDYGDNDPIYVKDKSKGKYIITNHRKGTLPIYHDDFQTIFPRMWSNQKSGHVRLYKQYGNVKGVNKTIRKPDGTSEVRQKPTFGENLLFFFKYQVGHMYLRYFMWNFAGRQNNIESQGEPEHGNWISGLDFLDSSRIGTQKNLPDSMKNPAHNKFYFLPLLLGLAGFFYQLKRSKRDTLVVALLFIMTGFAIVIFLNQYPLQPRERDYAYTGSFYAFAIWIGLGVLSVFQFFEKHLKTGGFSIFAATAVCLVLVPGIMAQQGWDDHNRANKYAARDFAVNYLESCDPNAVLITFGDNDTFPLWYAQEVENVRTDIRVVNHMLASGYWYCLQLGKKVYDADPLPFTLTPWQYQKGVNDYVPVYDRGIKGHSELRDIINFIADKRDETKLALQDGMKINYSPTKKVRLTVNAAKCIENGIVPPELADQIVPYIEWEIKQNALYKNDLMLLDFLATSDWERPLYLANPSSLLDVLGIDEYLHQEGMVYKFMPVKAKNYIKEFGGVNADKSYDILVNCTWGNLHDPRVSIDRETARNLRLPLQSYSRVAETLMMEGKAKKAASLLDTCLYYFPDEKFPYDLSTMPFADIYYKAGEVDKGNAVVTRMAEVYEQNLDYYNSLSRDFSQKHYSNDMQRALAIINRLGEIAKENGQTELGAEIDSIFTQQVSIMQF